MASLYNEADKNVQRTWLLMAGFCIAVIGLGFAFSYILNEQAILYGAVTLSLIMNIGSYWYSDKLALASSGAVLAEGPQWLELNRIVENLAITSGLPKPRVYIINDPAPNAFATGRDPKHAAVAVTSGLLNMMERSELEGVLAHELSHIKNRDTLLMCSVVVLIGFITLLSDFFLRSLQFRGGDDRDGRLQAGLVVLGLVLALVSPLIAQLIQLAISRRREFLADASGALITRYPEGLASALKKIGSYNAPMRSASNATAHLYISNPFGAARGAWLNLFLTHPPIEARIKALLGR